METTSDQSQLRSLITGHFEQSSQVTEAFFKAEAGRVAEACWAMARRFHQGGRILSIGTAASESDAQHVAVEFVHPVLVGKRALPALALTGAGQMGLLSRPQDIAIVFSPDGNNDSVLEALAVAKRKGLLTLALTGGDGGRLAQAELDFCFVVPSANPWLVQETHRTLYHILWELVHVFFEHEGLLEL